MKWCNLSEIYTIYPEYLGVKYQVVNIYQLLRYHACFLINGNKIMQLGPSKLWTRYHPEFLPLKPEQQRVWLKREFGFCFPDGNFDAKTFAHWYENTEPFDKECWFKHLLPNERLAVLKIWSEQDQKRNSFANTIPPATTSENSLSMPALSFELNAKAVRSKQPETTNPRTKKSPSPSTIPTFLFEIRMLAEKKEQPQGKRAKAQTRKPVKKQLF